MAQFKSIDKKLYKSKNHKFLLKKQRKTLILQKIIFLESFSKGQTSVDLVVLSDKFKLIPQEKRLDYLYQLIKDLYPDFHVFGFTPYEFEKASKLTIIEEIKKYGKVIYSA